MKHLLLIFFGWLCHAILFGGNNGTWEVPSQYTVITNPEAITTQTILNGQRIYASKCAACHGINADGKGLIAAPSFKNSAFNTQHDGEIFYKISIGRNQMPAFRAQLSEQQIWQVIHYLRSLTDHEHYPVITLKPATIELQYDSLSRTIIAIALNEQSDTVTNVRLQFFARQSFGWLPFAQAHIDSSKKIAIQVPTDIMGDTLGRLKVKAQLIGNGEYVDTSTTIEVQAAMRPPVQQPFFSQRALWNTQRKSPRWLILMSITVLTIVYGTLIYVIVLMFRLRKQGQIFIK